MLKNKVIALLFVLASGCSGSSSLTSVRSIPTMPLPSIRDAGQHDESSPTTNPNMAPAFAITRPDAGAEFIHPMHEGDQAPFNGVLFNAAAIARVEVEMNHQRQRCLIDQQTEIRRHVARSQADISLLESRIETNERINQIIIQARDQEIQLLQRHLRANQSSPVWQYVVIGVGSAIVGAGIAGVAVHFSHAATSSMP